MPKPNSGESQSDFVARCIPIVMNDGTADTNDQAVAICYSIFEQHNKKTFSYGEKKFNTQKELFNYLTENKSFLIAEKKVNKTYAEAVVNHTLQVDGAAKSTNIADVKGNELKVKLVLNTTNVMDSHSDVHIDGIWNKTLQEQKNLYLLQEHQMKFENVITDKVNASVSNMNWMEVGVNAIGKTQALIFDATIDKSRNPFMFEQYAKGYVKNHSVGMVYQKLELAINDNSNEFKAEKAVWDKYINNIVNKTQVEEQGYFWAVKEAKLIEGSAVLVGSNKITPTLSVSDKSEPEQSTHKNNVPEQSTQNKEQIKQLITNFNFLK